MTIEVTSQTFTKGRSRHEGLADLDDESTFHLSVAISHHSVQVGANNLFIAGSAEQVGLTGHIPPDAPVRRKSYLGITLPTREIAPPSASLHSRYSITGFGDHRHDLLPDEFAEEIERTRLLVAAFADDFVLGASRNTSGETARAIKRSLVRAEELMADTEHLRDLMQQEAPQGIAHWARLRGVNVPTIAQLGAKYQAYVHGPQGVPHSRSGGR